MPVLVETHDRCLAHDSGAGHPERPERLRAVRDGVEQAGLGDEVITVSPRPATREELERVHPPAFLDALERFCSEGGGAIDNDTRAGPESWDAALVAAGAALDAIDRLDRGEADAAFCAVRPPGHHTSRDRPMGFCLLNNVAVAAAALAERGERRDRRLGRPPRQRDPAHLLRRRARPVRVHAPVAAIPGHGPAGGHRGG